MGLTAGGAFQDAMVASGNPRCVVSATKVMVNADVLFTITGGPIQILNLLSECVTANNATGSTLQYQSVPTVGSAQTISGATTTLASVAAGTTVVMSPTALSTAPVISLAAAGGAQLGLNVGNKVTVNAGTIKAVIGAGSTTGTWRHYLAYIPMAPGVTVT